MKEQDNYSFEELADSFLTDNDENSAENVDDIQTAASSESDRDAPEESTAVKDDENSDKLQKKDVFDTMQVVFQSLIIVALIFVFVFRVASVNGTSMEPTLQSNDKLIISNVDFNYQRGDIVIVAQPNMLNEVLIKRIIALPGETINIVDGVVTVDGAALKEDYVADLIVEMGNIVLPHVVAPGCVFVMGDNRNDSTDSRFLGVGDINKKYIVGEAKARFFPFNNMTAFKNVKYDFTSGENNK